MAVTVTKATPTKEGAVRALAVVHIGILTEFGKAPWSAEVVFGFTGLGLMTSDDTAMIRK